MTLKFNSEDLSASVPSSTQEPHNLKRDQNGINNRDLTDIMEEIRLQSSPRGELFGKHRVRLRGSPSTMPLTKKAHLERIGRKWKFVDENSESWKSTALRAVTSDVEDELLLLMNKILNARASPLTTNANLGVNGGEMIAFDPTLIIPPFFIPSYVLIGTSPNKPAFSQIAFNANMLGLCSLDEAQNLVRSLSSSKDIFSPYWPYSVTDSASWYSSINGSSFDPGKTTQYEFKIKSASLTTVVFNVLINATSFTQSTIQLDPMVIDSSSFIHTSMFSNFSLSSSDADPTSYVPMNTFNIYVDVINRGSDAGFIQLIPWHCCYGSVDIYNKIIFSNGVPNAHYCSNWFFTASGKTLDVGETNRFLFQRPSVPFGLSGYCAFNISTSVSNYISTVEVGFSVPLNGEHPPSSVPLSPAVSIENVLPSSLWLDETIIIANGSQSPCDPPRIRMSSFPFCKQPCTIDQTWIDATTSGSTGSCIMVDCEVKYLGARNISNATQGLCKMSANLGPLPTSPPPTPSYESPISSPGTNLSSAFHEQPDGNLTIADCGPHGFFNENSTACICHEGWKDPTDAGYSDFIFCSVSTTRPILIKAKTSIQKAEFAQFILYVLCPLAIAASAIFATVSIILAIRTVSREL